MAHDIQGNPCWVFSSFHQNISLICKHDSNRRPRNKPQDLWLLSWICFWFCLTTVLYFSQPVVPKWSVCLWFFILLFPVTGYCRRISYLQLYSARSIPGQVWQVSSWQGWMEHLISTCCTVKAAHQQPQSSVCVHGWPVQETGFVLHTHIFMN